MARREERVLVVGPAFPVRGGISSLEKMMHDYCPREIKLLQHSTTTDTSKIAKLLQGLCSWIVFPIALLLHRPRVVHIHFSSFFSTWRKLPIALMSKIAMRRIILHSHGSEFANFYNDSSGLSRFLIRRFLGTADLIIALSESWKSFYEDQVGVNSAVRVMSTPIVFPEERQLLNDEGVVNIRFSGRIGARKGVWDLLDVISDNKENWSNRVKFTFTGDGELDRAREFVDSNELASFVDVLEWLPSDEFEDLMARTHVFILPSYDEGVPMALIESMGHGQVPISTPVGGIPEIIVNGENGILVTPGDKQEISAAIERLVGDGSQLRSMGTEARMSVEKFGIVEYMGRMAEIYRTI